MRGVLGRVGNLARVFGSVFRNRELARVETAFALFGMAEAGTWVAILVFAYGQGGPMETGIVAVALLAPAALTAPFASVLGDRFRRSRVLLLAYLVQAATMLATGAVLMVGAPVVVVYTVAAVASAVLTLTRPVHSALLPQVARTPEELTAANAVTGTFDSGTVLLGPSIAGILLAVEGSGLVFVVFGVSTLVAAALAARVTPAPAPERPPAHPLREAVDGFAGVVKRRDVRLLVGLLAARSIVVGALDVMVVVIALGLLDIGRSGAGFLTAALGAGGLLGGMVALTLVGRRRLAPPLALGLLLLGLPVAAVGIVAHPVVAALLLLAGGSGLTVADVAGRTLLQRVARDEVLTRVFGVLEGLDMAALAVGSFVAPTLAAAVAIEPALAMVGLFLPLFALLLWSRLRAVDRSAPTRLVELNLLRKVPLFAPLAAPVLESLAGSAIMVDAAEGERVIREGEEGDRFYVIAEGSVEVSREGTPVATLGPGDYFGEIALLRDVPRTATVIAKGPVRLLALERADFLEAVTGHPVSRQEAETVADRRLR